LGYHGCDNSVAEGLISGQPFKPSSNDYDWLGPGVYFWEVNPQRGLDFAREKAARKGSSVRTPAVVGAVIDLGLCLDLSTHRGIEMLKAAHRSLAETFDALHESLPKNDGDLLRRRLDCAVVRRLHSILEDQGRPLDTVRGVFVEGPEIYPSAGFRTKTHVQIAVRNLKCIKGVFRVPDDDLKDWASTS